jgi:hypothetical protein
MTVSGVGNYGATETHFVSINANCAAGWPNFLTSKKDIEPCSASKIDDYLALYENVRCYQVNAKRRSSHCEGWQSREGYHSSDRDSHLWGCY